MITPNKNKARNIVPIKTVSKEADAILPTEPKERNIVPAAPISLAKNKDNANLYNIDLKEYQPYLGDVVNLASNIDKARALKQETSEQVLRTASNLIPNIALGIVENAGYLLDMGAMASTVTGEGDDYSNFITEFAKKHRNPFGETYLESPQETFDIQDPAWWLTHGGGLVESVGEFLVTGFGVGKVLGSGAKALSRALKSGRDGQNLANAGAKILTSASLAYTEGAMSGAQIYDNVVRKRLAGGDSFEEANKIASQAAAHTVKLNTTINTLLNMSSVSALFVPTNKLAGAAAFNTKRAVGETKEAFIKRLQQAAEYNPTIAKTLRSLGAEAGQEAAEEFVNVFAETEGERKAALDSGEDLMTDQTGNVITRAARVATSEEGILSMMLGAVGGVAQTGLMSNIPVYKQMEDGKFVKRSARELEVLKAVRERKNIFTEIENDLNELDKLNRELNDVASRKVTQKNPAKAAREQRNKEIELENIRTKIFDIRSKKSIKNGTVEPLMGELQRIAELDNSQPYIDKNLTDQKKSLQDQITQLSKEEGNEKAVEELIKEVQKIEEQELENSKTTEAIKAGVAIDRDDNNYKERAAKTISRIKKLEAVWNDIQDSYLSEDELATGLDSYLFDIAVAKDSIEEGRNIINTELEKVRAARDEAYRQNFKESDNSFIDYKSAKDLQGRLKGVDNTINRNAKVLEAINRIRNGNAKDSDRKLVSKMYERFGINVDEFYNDNPLELLEEQLEASSEKMYNEKIDITNKFEEAKSRYKETSGTTFNDALNNVYSYDEEIEQLEAAKKDNEEALSSINNQYTKTRSPKGRQEYVDTVKKLIEENKLAAKEKARKEKLEKINNEQKVESKEETTINKSSKFKNAIDDVVNNLYKVVDSTAEERAAAAEDVYNKGMEFLNSVKDSIKTDKAKKAFDRIKDNLSNLKQEGANVLGSIINEGANVLGSIINKIKGDIKEVEVEGNVVDSQDVEVSQETKPDVSGNQTDFDDIEEATVVEDVDEEFNVDDETKQAADTLFENANEIKGDVESLKSSALDDDSTVDKDSYYTNRTSYIIYSMSDGKVAGEKKPDVETIKRNPITEIAESIQVLVDKLAAADAKDFIIKLATMNNKFYRTKVLEHLDTIVAFYLMNENTPETISNSNTREIIEFVTNELVGSTYVNKPRPTNIKPQGAAMRQLNSMTRNIQNDLSTASTLGLAGNGFYEDPTAVKKLSALTVATRTQDFKLKIEPDGKITLVAASNPETGKLTQSTEIGTGQVVKFVVDKDYNGELYDDLGQVTTVAEMKKDYNLNENDNLWSYLEKKNKAYYINKVPIKVVAVNDDGTETDIGYMHDYDWIARDDDRTNIVKEYLQDGVYIANQELQKQRIVAERTKIINSETPIYSRITGKSLGFANFDIDNNYNTVNKNIKQTDNIQIVVTDGFGQLRTDENNTFNSDNLAYQLEDPNPGTVQIVVPAPNGMKAAFGVFNPKLKDIKRRNGSEADTVFQILKDLVTSNPNATIDSFSQAKEILANMVYLGKANKDEFNVEGEKEGIARLSIADDGTIYFGITGRELVGISSEKQFNQAEAYLKEVIDNMQFSVSLGGLTLNNISYPTLDTNGKVKLNDAVYKDVVYATVRTNLKGISIKETGEEAYFNNPVVSFGVGVDNKAKLAKVYEEETDNITEVTNDTDIDEDFNIGLLSGALDVSTNNEQKYSTKIEC